MSTNNGSPSERVQSSYAKLAAAASSLNEATDQLGKTIGSLDESLKTLNLGVSCWHLYAEREDEHDNFTRKYIGYNKIGTRWGVAISRVSGNANSPNDEIDDEWLFNDAPRQLRIEAIEHIPAMIDALVKTAETTVKKIQRKITEAQELADALQLKSVPQVPAVRR